MNTARLYQKIISIIQQSFIEPAERFGLSVVELKEPVFADDTNLIFSLITYSLNLFTASANFC
jgi:hypothetical protein